jgi:Sec-independent protein translocase protein TatA
MFPAISMPGLQEWVLIAIIAVLVFGRRLPEVIAEVLSVWRQVRRQLDDLRRSTGFDQDLREAQRALDDARATVRRETRVLTAPAPRIQSASEAVRRGVKDLEEEIRRAVPPAGGVVPADAGAAGAAASGPATAAAPDAADSAQGAAPGAVDPAPVRGPDPEPR